MSDFTGDYKQDKEKIDRTLRVEESFDLQKHEFLIGEKQACLYCIDGMMKDELLQKLLQYFAGVAPEEVPEDAGELIKKILPNAQNEVLSELDTVIATVLTGVPCMLVEGCRQAIAVDARSYPTRSVEEPDKDKVMRGSRDGFVETLTFNTALVRRRIRDPRLTMCYKSAGAVSKTDIVICYMEGRVDRKFLAEIKKRIEEIRVESLTMNQESLAECLFHGRWYNPFPKFKFSERPDTAAAAILEGDIVLLVDNSPAAMILPTTIFDIIEDADDYYFPPITGTYLRLSRFVTSFLSLFLTPFFLLMMQHPEWLSDRWQFVVVKESMNIPLIWQFLILEFALDGLRLASINTPSMLSLPLSVIAGIVIGDFTVQSGWFNSEAMLYMAFVAIANYTQVSLELGYALKFMRIILLLLTEWFGIWGFVGGTILDILAICCNKTIGGRSYLYPLIPLKPRQLLQRIFRVPLPKSDNQQGR